MVVTSPVHSPVHGGPVQSPESRFCSVPYHSDYATGAVVQLVGHVATWKCYKLCADRRESPTVSSSILLNRYQSEDLYKLGE